jgi:hypothetical protein
MLSLARKIHTAKKRDKPGQADRIEDRPIQSLMKWLQAVPFARPEQDWLMEHPKGDVFQHTEPDL